VVAHHERPVGWLPLRVGKNGPRIPRGAPVTLDELLEVIRGDSDLVVDLRSWFGDPAPDFARAVLDAHSDRTDLTVTCESWVVADRLRAWLPGFHVAYSVRSERQLRAYIQGRTEGSLEPVPVTVRHSLLHDRLEVDALRRHAPRVAVWTVDDAARALELASWGVDEVVSNRLDVLRTL
jgi:hypothetical protein